MVGCGGGGGVWCGGGSGGVRWWSVVVTEFCSDGVVVKLLC